MEFSGHEMSDTLSGFFKEGFHIHPTLPIDLETLISPPESSLQFVWSERIFRWWGGGLIGFGDLGLTSGAGISAGSLS